MVHRRLSATSPIKVDLYPEGADVSGVSLIQGGRWLVTLARLAKGRRNLWLHVWDLKDTKKPVAAFNISKSWKYRRLYPHSFVVQPAAAGEVGVMVFVVLETT